MTINFHEKYDPKLTRVLVTWNPKAAREQGHISHHYYVAFAEFLGFPCQEGCSYIVDITNPKIQELLDMFDGPHCATMLKVFAARREGNNA